MNAHLNLVPWLAGAPVVAALLAPLLGFPLRGRPRHLVNAILELGLLALAILTLQDPPTAPSWTYGMGGSVDLLALSLDRPAAVGIVLLAVLFLAITAFSAGVLGTTRNGGAFLSVLLLEQAAGGVVLLAANLFTLYLALFLLDVSLMLLVGIDFTPAGGRAALRVFATPEVPAVVALVSYWLIAARSGTAAFADLPGQGAWLAGPTTTLLVLPIVVALAARAGLVPFHRWVVAGCRNTAAPGAVAIGAIATPLGGYALWRVALAALPLAPYWTLVLAVLGALTMVVGSVGALRERTALGWLSYAALVQVGLVVVGLSAGPAAAWVGGWLALVGGSLALALVGLSLGLMTRATREEAIGGPVVLPRDALSRLSLGLGFLAVAGFPPFSGFTARVYLLTGLVAAPTALDAALALLIVVGTLLFAAATWKALTCPIRSTSPNGDGYRAEGVLREPELVRAGAPAGGAPIPAEPARARGREELRSLLRDPHWAVQRADGPGIALESRLALGALLILVILPSFLAPASLAGILGSAVPRLPFALALAVTVVLILTLAAALALRPAWDRLTAHLRLQKRVTCRVIWLGERLHLDDVADPYLVVGATLAFLGHVAAELLDNTLGRLARIG